MTVPLEADRKNSNFFGFTLTSLKGTFLVENYTSNSVYVDNYGMTLLNFDTVGITPVNWPTRYYLNNRILVSSCLQGTCPGFFNIGVFDYITVDNKQTLYLFNMLN